MSISNSRESSYITNRLAIHPPRPFGKPTLRTERCQFGSAATGLRATNEEGRFEIKGLLAGNIYKMDSSNVQRFVSRKNQLTVDLTNAKPGDVLELGDVTGKNAKSSK